MLTLVGTGHFAIFDATGGGVAVRPPRVWPLTELEFRDKNERIGRDESEADDTRF